MYSLTIEVPPYVKLDKPIKGFVIRFETYEQWQKYINDERIACKHAFQKKHTAWTTEQVSTAQVALFHARKSFFERTHAKPEEPSIA